MKLRGILVSLGVLAGLSLAMTNANAATTYVKVGRTNHNFVKTQRTIKVNEQFSTTKSFTIPKYTIVEVTQNNKPNDKSGKQYVTIDMSRLSYHLRGKHARYTTKRILASTVNFKKVKVPQYVQYYTTQKTYPTNIERNRTADGNLYPGIKVPDNFNGSKDNWTQRVYVTADGYLEYYAKARLLSTAGEPVPTVSAKITKVKRVPSHGTTALYTQKSIASKLNDRVSKTGTQQYVTTIKRRYRSSATIIYSSVNPTAVDHIDMAAQYQINGHDFFMMTDVVYPSN